MRALNIDVGASLVAQWRAWFAPGVQPFLVDDVLARSMAWAEGATGSTDITQHPAYSAEVRDTFALYNIPDGVRCVWLSEAEFMGLPQLQRAALVRAQHTWERELVPSVRAHQRLVGDVVRTQADGHRFVWWPSLLAGIEDHVLTEYIEEGRRASRHDEVPERVWTTSSTLLPGARRLAGTFPQASGPNCFGTVMAASGVDGADMVWMLREPFEAWLADTTRPGGQDDEPGTVLVWRSPDGLVQHAAVTLGEGWALHKPSQGWMSPTKVLRVRECIASSRDVGRRLERRALMADLRQR